MYLSDNRGILPARLVIPLLAVLLCFGVAVRVRGRALQEVAWPDEAIYLVGARNVVERGTLATNFYLTYSLLRRGYPHRDVHMPGYVLVLTPVVAVMGATLRAASVLNVALFAGSAVLVWVLARRLTGDDRRAAASALLFTVLPPFPGYLFVAYPELLVTFAFLAALVVLVHARGVRGAAAAGVAYAAGALARETLLLALPLYFVRLDRRAFWRGFVPAALATLVLVVAPLSRDRAVHPNALFPSVIEEARGSETPVRTLAAALKKNVATNLRLSAAADPAARPEDATLLFLMALVALAVLGASRDVPEVRRFGHAVLASLALLTVAVVVFYVVRERGGVWGGVRAYMCWAPVLLVFATRLVPRRPGAAALAAGIAATLFIGLDLWQIRFFNRYKGTDLEDQSRQAAYLAKWVDAEKPHRIVAQRAFLYGYTHYPIEVVWSVPADGRELSDLNQAIGYEFLVIHERNGLRRVLMNNPRFLRVNKEDRGAEFLVWRRIW